MRYRLVNYLAKRRGKILISPFWQKVLSFRLILCDICGENFIISSFLIAVEYKVFKPMWCGGGACSFPSHGKEKMFIYRHFFREDCKFNRELRAFRNHSAIV